MQNHHQKLLPSESLLLRLQEQWAYLKTLQSSLGLLRYAYI